MKKIVISVWVGLVLQPSIFASSIEKSGDILQILIPSIAYGTTVNQN